MRDIDLSDIPDVEETEIDLSDIPDVQEIDLSDIPDVTEPEELIRPVDEGMMALPAGGVMPEEREEVVPPEGAPEDFWTKDPSFPQKAIDFITGGHITYDPAKLAPPPEVQRDPETGEEIITPPETAKQGFFEDPVTWATMGALQGLKYGGKAGGKLLRMARETLAWATGGVSEVPAIAKGGAKLAAKGIAAKPMEKTMAKAVLKEPLGREAIQVAEKEAVAGIPAATRLAPESEFLQKEFGERFLKPAEKPKLPTEVTKKPPTIEKVPKEVGKPTQAELEAKLAASQKASLEKVKAEKGIPPETEILPEELEGVPDFMELAEKRGLRPAVSQPATEWGVIASPEQIKDLKLAIKAHDKNMQEFSKRAAKAKEAGDMEKARRIISEKGEIATGQGQGLREALEASEGKWPAQASITIRERAAVKPKAEVVKEIPPPAPKFVVEKGERKKYVEMILDEVKEGGPPITLKFRGEYGHAEYRRTGSTYPDFMRKKGWTKKEVIIALNKGLKNEKLGKRQQQIWDEAITDAEIRYRRDAETLGKGAAEGEELPASLAAPMKKTITFYAGIPIHKAGEAYTKHIGEPIWDKLVMKKIPKLLEKVPGGKAVNRALIYKYRGDLPNTGKYIHSMEDMRRAQSVGREYAIDLGKRLQKLPEESQLKMGEYITTKEPTVKLSLDELHLAKEAKAAMLDLGKQAVDAGLLAEETFFKNAGRYMPRLYTSKEYQGLLTRFSLKKPVRLDLSRFKMRKDIPKAIREEMGEILTPGYPIAKGITQLTHDIEMARFFKGISTNNEWALLKKTDLPIPTGWKQLPSNKKLGTLSEAHVHPEIFADLQETIRVMETPEKVWRKALGAWKFGKVIVSPKTHVRNLMSNSVLAHLGGLPMYEQPAYLTKAALAMKQKGKYWKAVREEGGFEHTFTSGELGALFDQVEGQMAGIKAGGIPEKMGSIGNA
ncbi:hypothetical protein KAR91_23100, partial [Candidatus Pacearchaeota archaeon]|nr:hypothetical protein [Candidatus Pacearchaeota archaeon]